MAFSTNGARGEGRLGGRGEENGRCSFFFTGVAVVTGDDSKRKLFGNESVVGVPLGFVLRWRGSGNRRSWLCAEALVLCAGVLLLVLLFVSATDCHRLFTLP